MKRFFVALLVGILLVSSTPAPASAAVVDCRVVVGTQTRVVCTAAGVVVLSQVINVPTPDPIIIVRPGPTVTIRPNPAPAPPPVTVTKNVPVPGPTVFVPGATTTTTAAPKPVPVPSKAPASAPTQTVPKQSVSPTGQGGLDHGTVEPSKPDRGEHGIRKLLPSPKQVAKGAISLLVLMVLMLLALYAGYYLGYRDRGSKEARFLRALRDQTLLKKR